MKFPLGEIKKNGGESVDFDPRQQHVDREDENPESPPPESEIPLHIGRMNEVMRTVLVDGGDGLAIGLFGREHWVDGRSALANSLDQGKESVLKRNAMLDFRYWITEKIFQGIGDLSDLNWSLIFGKEAPSQKTALMCT